MTAPAPRSVLTGIALAACGYALFSIQDASMKWLVQSYAVPELMAIRSSVIILLALLVGGPRRSLAGIAASHSKPLLVARAGLILSAWSLFYSASAHMGLAELTTLYFAAPVIAVCLSILILKERVDAVRWGAVLVGFAGVMVAAGPTGELVPGPTVMALAAAACWGTSTILVRWIGRSDSTLTQVLASNTLFTLGCLPFLPWVWRTPDLTGSALIIGLGVAGGAGQYFLFEGYRHAPASALAPIEYSGLVWAFLYGYAVWGDVPGSATFAGAGLIVAGSVGLIWFESRRARAIAAASTAA